MNMPRFKQVQPFGGESSHPRAVFAVKSRIIEFEVGTSDDLVAPNDIRVSSTVVEKDTWETEGSTTR